MCQARAIRRRFAARRARKALLQVETLEYRDLPAIFSANVAPASRGLGSPRGIRPGLAATGAVVRRCAGHAAQAAVAGNIGAGPNGAADVVWYHFTLDRSSQVTLGTFSQQQGTVLSLYNTDATDGSDPYDPLGHRLLVQADQAASGNQDAAPIVATWPPAITTSP